MNTFIALIKREISEHNSLWKVPLGLLILVVLIKLSFSFGNLSIDVDVPFGLNLDTTMDAILATAIGKTLSFTNWLIATVMFCVAIFYALSCLYDDRQDQSILFWRSLPISDTETVLAKLMVALLLVPLIILVLQCLVAVLFLGQQSLDYISSYLMFAISSLSKVLLWSMLPTLTWSLLCSQLANKNPFLMAVGMPILIIIIDWLFLNGILADTFVINRFSGVDHYTPTILIIGIVFSVACLALTIARRGERF